MAKYLNATSITTTVVKSYTDKLKDPRWQKKRLEIMGRDNFRCQLCDDDKTTLVVHHKRYISGKHPWDYKNELLITLCEKCHEKFHDKAKTPVTPKAKVVVTNLTPDYSTNRTIDTTKHQTLVPSLGALSKIRQEVVNRKTVEENRIPITKDSLDQFWKYYINFLKSDKNSAYHSFSECEVVVNTDISFEIHAANSLGIRFIEGEKRKLSACLASHFKSNQIHFYVLLNRKNAANPNN